MVAVLREVHPDRIVVSDETFYLRAGERCKLEPGTRVELCFSIRNERKEVERIVVAAPSS